MITIKIGGSVVDNLHPSTIDDIKKIVEQEGVILVHGGGKEVTKITEQLGKEPKFVVSPSGIKSRYTDKETSEIFTMVMSGKINKAIVQMLQKNGINALGLRRRKFSANQRTNIKKAYKIIYNSNHNTSQALEKIKNELKIKNEISTIINFIKNSSRGLI